jgi:hypothetical protein
MKKDISEIKGKLGQAFIVHNDQLSNLKATADINAFLSMVEGELGDEAKKYLNDEVRPQVSQMPFSKAYKYLYNILLAGFAGCKLS